MTRAIRKKAKKKINKQNRMMKRDEEKLNQTLHFKYLSEVAHTHVGDLFFEKKMSRFYQELI